MGGMGGEDQVESELMGDLVSFLSFLDRMVVSPAMKKISIKSDNYLALMQAGLNPCCRRPSSLPSSLARGLKLQKPRDFVPKMAKPELYWIGIMTLCVFSIFQILIYEDPCKNLRSPRNKRKYKKTSLFHYNIFFAEKKNHSIFIARWLNGK